MASGQVEGGISSQFEEHNFAVHCIWCPQHFRLLLSNHFLWKRCPPAFVCEQCQELDTEKEVEATQKHELNEKTKIPATGKLDLFADRLAWYSISIS